MKLSINEFKKLTVEGQQEYVYFTQAFHEATNMMQGIEMGLKFTAGYVVDVEGTTNAIKRIKLRDAWVEKELETQERYQELKEDKERYQKRLERIESMVQEG